MKIYFEDGELRPVWSEIPYKIDVGIDARFGYSFCEDMLLTFKHNNYDAVVYTNMITALRNEYAWNEELKVSEIYIRNKDGKFTRINELTEKCLREGHNIMRMYIAGAFEEG